MSVATNHDNRRADDPCDHGVCSLFPEDTPMYLTVTHGWFRCYMRCWLCDMKEDLGPRKEIKTQADGLRVWSKRYTG